MKKVPGGEQELALLRYVAEKGPLSVGEAFEDFGSANALARSTVLTMMERLRKKGHLVRRRADGVFKYTSRVPHEELLRDVVGQFVDRALNGSVTPFASWLADKTQVSDSELAELEAAVQRLREKSSHRGDA